VTALLKGTTEKGGTGEGAISCWIRGGRKTGTAQKVDANGRICRGSVRQWLMGLRLSRIQGWSSVVIDEPQRTNYGEWLRHRYLRPSWKMYWPYLRTPPEGDRHREERERTFQWISSRQEPTHSWEISKWRKATEREVHARPRRTAHACGPQSD